jgi:hypothetical protein
MKKKIQVTPLLARVFFLLLLSLCAADVRPALAALTVADQTAFWKFDEGGGATVSDSSNNLINGTLQGGAQRTTGRYGSALQCNGTNACVSVSANSLFNASGDFTVDMWINPAQWGEDEILLNNNVFQLYHRGGWAGDRLYFMLKIDPGACTGDSAWDGWAAVQTMQPMLKENWYHVAAVRSGTGMAIYLNGVKEREIPTALSIYPIVSSGMGNLYIGSGGTGRYFNGMMDEVRIWNKALSPAEIQGLYAAYPPAMNHLLDQTAYEGSQIQFLVQATAMNSNITYTATGLPEGASLRSLPANEIIAPYLSGRNFNWAPAVGQTGTFPITITAANGSATNTQTVTITVKPNSLLHGASGGLICRGDGEYAADVRRDYGADANPTGEPVGGGVGYSLTADSTTANYYVTTKAQLLTALGLATAGQVIYIADDAQLDMTGSYNLTIPGGVTLASGRGRNNSAGALIRTDALWNTIEPLKNVERALLITGGTGVRVTGLRITGPDQDRREEQMYWLYAQTPARDTEVPYVDGIRSGYSNLTVDNCELCGWSFGAVSLTSSNGNSIHHNYIHHNQTEGMGYGVVLTNDSSVLVEANVFNWNRHDIAGGRGLPGGSYEARYNISLGYANDHNFDMHGGNDVGDAAVPAGNTIRIHHNTFVGTSGKAAARIRGIPVTGCWVNNNWALHDPAKYTSGQVFVQFLTNLPGHTPYENMQVYDNILGPTPPPATGTNFTTPGVPLNLAAAAGDRQVTLNWEVPVSSGSRAITGYGVYRDDTKITLVGNSRSYTDTGLTNGTTYSYQVTALSSIGEGARSAAVSAVTCGAGVQPDVQLQSYAYPNPADLSAGGKVRIMYSAPAEAKVSILIYTVAGEMVKTLVNDETLAAGEHYADWSGDTDSGRRISSGVYLAVIRAGGRKTVNKIAVIR